MSFPGLPNRGLGSNSTAGMSDQEAKMVKAVRFPLQIQEDEHFLARTRSLRDQMQAAMESCVAKTAISGVMGFALGGAFGLFMSSVCKPTQ